MVEASPKPTADELFAALDPAELAAAIDTFLDLLLAWCAAHPEKVEEAA